MNLRICDSGHEQTLPASVELGEQAFTPDGPIKEATEIALAEGEALQRFREFMST